MSTTVLFVHGLESGPRGAKSRTLEQAGFTVVAGQMPCGRAAIVRDPVVVAVAVGVVAAIGAATVGFGGLGLGLALAIAAALTPIGRALLVRRMVRRSLAVQLDLLRRHPIDVVVGSSFGGAVAVALLARGAWTGPTVLLCPAHRLVAARGWRRAPQLPPAAPGIVVVHGRADAIVPIDHSRALIVGTAAELVEVDDDHRLSASTTPALLADWVGRALRPPPG